MTTAKTSTKMGRRYDNFYSETEWEPADWIDLDEYKEHRRSH